MFSFKKNLPVDTNQELIEEILTRSVSAVYPSKEAVTKLLLSGKRLKIYLGADATGSDLHIGHATNLILLERLRKLGHEIVVLFGDFTAMIGDPTDKNATRTPLTEAQVADNIRGWKDQVAKVIQIKDKKNPPTFVKNSTWLAKLSFKDVVSLASNFTVQQMLERDMFEKRMSEQKPIHLHEFMYPLMQGYDSVALGVDGEVGGNDQTFNMLAGRILQRSYNNKEKFVITTTLLVNPKTGKKLMSKSEGGYIALNDSPTNMFGKTMALPDETIISVFIDCTYVKMDEIKKIQESLTAGANPRDIKVRLAKELVTMYHGALAAETAAKAFDNTFKKGEIPSDTVTVAVQKGSKLVDVLVAEKIVASKNEFRRLVLGNGVSEFGSDTPITNAEYTIEHPAAFRIGKKRFLKVSLK
ncbi:MAG: hypothetical protein RIT04_201 [Candidatus Parcubacteria bacterium]|jgi:tyrosyl-tRNA synthetase